MGWEVIDGWTWMCLFKESLKRSLGNVWCLQSFHFISINQYLQKVLKCFNKQKALSWNFAKQLISERLEFGCRAATVSANYHLCTPPATPPSKQSREFHWRRNKYKYQTKYRYKNKYKKKQNHLDDKKYECKKIKSPHQTKLNNLKGGDFTEFLTSKYPCSLQNRLKNNQNYLQTYEQRLKFIKVSMTMRVCWRL